LSLRDPIEIRGEGRAGMFVVDNDDTYEMLPSTARPTVALLLHADEGPERSLLEGRLGWRIVPMSTAGAYNA